MTILLWWHVCGNQHCTKLCQMCYWWRWSCKHVKLQMPGHWSVTVILIVVKASVCLKQSSLYIVRCFYLFWLPHLKLFKWQPSCQPPSWALQSLQVLCAFVASKQWLGITAHSCTLLYTREVTGVVVWRMKSKSSNPGQLLSDYCFWNITKLSDVASLTAMLEKWLSDYPITSLVQSFIPHCPTAVYTHFL